MLTVMVMVIALILMPVMLLMMLMAQVLMRLIMLAVELIQLTLKHFLLTINKQTRNVSNCDQCNYTFSHIMFSYITAKLLSLNPTYSDVM